VAHGPAVAHAAVGEQNVVVEVDDATDDVNDRSST
jgi:hypothetical protein